MDQQTSKSLPQRAIDWVKSLSGSGDATDTAPPAEGAQAGDSGATSSIRGRAAHIGGRARTVAGDARTRGQGAVDDLKRRREERSFPGSGDVKKYLGQITDRARDAASRSGDSGGHGYDRTELRPEDTASESGSEATDNALPQDTGMPEGASSESGDSSDRPSVAWATTAGVVEPGLSDPSTFIDAELSAAGTGQDTGEQGATPGDRSTATPHVDTTAPVAGNAEEGTRNEAASAATQARTNAPGDKPVVQATDDPIGGQEDRTPGTGSATASSEPFAFNPSGSDTGTDHPPLGADTDDGSSITELSSEETVGESSLKSRWSTVSADAYRSAAAPEEVLPEDEGTESRRPEPGSSIPDFATDADDPTRTVEGGPDTDAQPSREETSS